MSKRFLSITLAAFALCFLASSCVKEAGFENRVRDIVNAQRETLVTRVDSLYKEQIALNDSLKNVKKDVEELSKQSKDLTDSIAAVKDSLAAQKKWTKEQLDAIDVRVTTIEEAQKSLKTEVYERLGKLESRIQKIDVIPDYNDGSVEFGKGDNVLNFVVRPDSVAQKLAAAYSTGDSTFSFIVVPTLTKAVTMDTLNVKGVAYADGILSVTVKDEQGKIDAAFYKGEQSYSACLVIGDGNSDNTSGFFPLTPAVATANCYIVSEAGTYKFKAVKGNSGESVGDVKGVKVLWESDGTSTSPGVGGIIKADVKYLKGYIIYSTNDTFKEGNAVIAAYSDAGCTDGNVLWSWHIWCTDQPEEQEYNNGAGFMMDRNLGATSADKGQVSALGLMYQWGRKDPFLGANGIKSSIQAASTLNTWQTVPAQDNSSDRELNLKTSIKKPTTFITNGTAPFDWYCTDVTYKNDNLWKNATGSAKTIYDPCPVGWRVPDGGTKSAGGVWAKAFNYDGQITESSGFSNGFDFGTTSKTLVSGTCWYPAAGLRLNGDNSIYNVGDYGYCWSCTPSSTSTYLLYFNKNPHVFPAYNDGELYRARGYNVRCLKE